MPKVNGDLWKQCRDELDLTSEQAAARLKISGGYLRNVEGGTNEPSNRLIHRAARLYGRPYAELIDAGESPKQPTAPKPQRKEPTSKRSRRSKETAA